MPTYNVMPFPKFFAVNASGTPYAGGKLWAYASGGLVTLQDTYSDSIGTPNTNPVTLDSAGRATVYLAPKAYAFELKDSNGVSIWTADPIYGFALTQDYGLCGGRLTLSSGVPVTTADVTAATTLYFTPYTGTALALYDGTVWGTFALTELSIALPAAASQVYDVFASQTAGVVSLSLVAWTNDTTRATGITLQNGVYVKSGGTSFRYLGSVRTTTVAGQTEDSLAKRYVYNWRNRVDRALYVIDTTANWAYTTATWRQARATATNQLDYLVGVQEDAVEARLLALAANDNIGVIYSVGIGVDSTTAPAATAGGLLEQVTTPVASLRVAAHAHYRGYPGVGRHVLVWLEISGAGVGTTTWYGASGTHNSQSGLVGVVRA